MKTFYDIDDEKSKTFHVDILIKPIESENASFKRTFIYTESPVYDSLTTTNSNDQSIH